MLMNDRLEVALAVDQHPVQAFAAATPDPALGVRVCSGRHQRSQDHAGAFRLEDPIGLGRKLLVPIVNQTAELDVRDLESPARLRACWVTQAAFGSECSSPARLDATPDLHIYIRT